MLNHVYRVVFNRSTGCYTAVSEASKLGSKSNNRSGQASTVGTVPAVTLGKSLRRSAIGVAIAGVLGLTAMSSQADVCITQPSGTNGSNAPEYRSIACGYNNIASGLRSSAVGYNSTASNGDSSAVGGNNTASGLRSSAMGYRNEAIGLSSSAVGYRNTAQGDLSLATGTNNLATGSNSTAVGRKNNASGVSSSAIGSFNTASNDYSSAVGYVNKASGNSSSAIGSRNSASRAGATAIGSGSDNIQVATADATVNDDFNTSISPIQIGADGRRFKDDGNGGQIFEFSAYERLGKGATADGIRSAALGNTSVASARDSLAMGTGSTANILNSIALGAQSRTTVEAGVTGYSANGNVSPIWQSTLGAVSVGDTSNADSNNWKTRQITGIAAGTGDTDAVNIAQLKRVETTGAAHFSSVAKALGGGAQFNSMGVFQAPTYTFGSNTYRDVGSAFVAVDGRLNKLESQGVQGDSAYEVAVKNGFNGTETEWLTSLKGEQGPAGQDGTKGDKGDKGDSGISEEARIELETQLEESKQHFVNVNTNSNEDQSNYSNLGAPGKGSIAIGVDTKSTGENSVSVGTGSTVTGNSSLSVGTKNTVSGNMSGAIGDPSIIGGDSSYSLGNDNVIGNTSNNVSVVGSNAKVGATGASVVNGAAVFTGVTDASNSVAIGESVNVQATNAVAIGANSNVTHTNSVALGAGSQTSADNTISVGGVNNQRRITNVAAGINPNDAVSLEQSQIGDSKTLDSANNYTNQRFASMDQNLSLFRGDVDSRFREQDQRIDRVGAMSAAIQNMGTSVSGMNQRNRIGLGMGFQGSEQAVAIGYQRVVSDKASLTFSGAFSDDESSAGVGVGFGW